MQHFRRPFLFVPKSSEEMTPPPLVRLNTTVVTFLSYRDREEYSPDWVEDQIRPLMIRGTTTHDDVEWQGGAPLVALPTSIEVSPANTCTRDNLWSSRQQEFILEDERPQRPRQMVKTARANIHATVGPRP